MILHSMQQIYTKIPGFVTLDVTTKRVKEGCPRWPMLFVLYYDSEGVHTAVSREEISCRLVTQQHGQRQGRAD